MHAVIPVFNCRWRRTQWNRGKWFRRRNGYWIEHWIILTLLTSTLWFFGKACQTTVMETRGQSFFWPFNQIFMEKICCETNQFHVLCFVYFYAFCRDCSYKLCCCIVQQIFSVLKARNNKLTKYIFWYFDRKYMLKVAG